MARSAVCFCSALSACSQVSAPNMSSCSTTSNSFPRGPSPSFFPTMEAMLSMTGGSSNLILAFPICILSFTPFLCKPYFSKKNTACRTPAPERSRLNGHISSAPQINPLTSHAPKRKCPGGTAGTETADNEAANAYKTKICPPTGRSNRGCREPSCSGFRTR